MESMIRIAKSEDLVWVQKIYDDIISYEEQNVKYTAFQANVYPVRDTAEKALAGNFLYVCEKDCTICASMIINQSQPDEYKNIDWNHKFSEHEIMVIHLLCVSPEYSGNGLGRKMIEFAVEEGKRHNCKSIRLDTGNQNIPAKSLYEKNGFTVAGINHMSIGGLIEHDTHLFYEKIIC
ncbi:MAG: GNAT family N-acetyltransferase [Ruminococcus sp.]|nr:GNAT family N-acetyltransferase [Ruminococcus sp.]MDE6849390.1 GNAT family N-acetyltransferase [Ruminococcus sp.]